MRPRRRQNEKIDPKAALRAHIRRQVLSVEAKRGRTLDEVEAARQNQLANDDVQGMVDREEFERWID